MKILTVTNRKGGVGKTTLTRTLADYFALERNLRVLIVDLDSQCSLSHLYLDMDMAAAGREGVRPPVHPDFDSETEAEEWSGRSSSADIFFYGAVYPYPVTHPKDASTLEILPGNSRLLTEVEEQDQPKLLQRVENRLREFFSMEDVQSAYDLVLLDTGPSGSPLARSALRACTHVLIPVELEPQCIRGLYEMIGMIRKEDMQRTLETAVSIIGIQPNKYKKRRHLHQGLLEAMQNEQSLAPYVSPVILPDRSSFAERDADQAKPRSIFQLRPSDPARKIATHFCEFVEARLNERGRYGETARTA